MTEQAEETELVEKACSRCGVKLMVEMPIDPVAREMIASLNIRLGCDPCKVQVRAELEAKEVDEARRLRFARWQKICPAEFQKPIDFKLCRKDLYGKVLKWRFGSRGLICTGRTGRCKTRFVFKLAEREFFAGRSVAYIRHPEFREEVSRLAFSDQTKLYHFLKPLREVDILIFDDLGKGRITEATEEALESLLDIRTRASDKPILFTTNDGDESLQARLSADRGEPMIRRIFDFCEPIDFGFE